MASLVALGLLLCGRAEAATQGETGASSRGAISIGVSVAPTIHTIGLSDVTLAGLSLASMSDNAQNVCVWSNTPTRGYSITAVGSGPANSFILANESMAARYSVSWSASTDRASGELLAPGTPLAGLTATASATGCASGTVMPANLVVRVAPARARLLDASYRQSIAADTGYSGALTLIVSPQ